jgi:hypothetical protein
MSLARDGQVREHQGEHDDVKGGRGQGGQSTRREALVWLDGRSAIRWPYPKLQEVALEHVAVAFLGAEVKRRACKSLVPSVE